MTDHLGSNRIVTDMSGNIGQCTDYYPFGEETSCNSNGDFWGVFYFTGQQHDFESDLDYFMARHYSSAQGRFMSPDWSASPQPVPYASLTDPQTLNLYGYVRNNPLSFWDPDGHEWLCGQTTYSHANGSTEVIANCADLPDPAEFSGLINPGELAGQLRLTSTSPYANLKGRCSVPNHPSTANLNSNIAAGQQHEGEPGNPDFGEGQFPTNLYLYFQFCTGCAEDYKTSDGPQYADFGNFNFGAVCGGMGFSLIYCQSAAGVGLMGRVGRKNAEYDLHIGGGQHQQYNGAGIPFLVPPFGDQPADSAQIAAGYAFQSAGCAR